MDIKTGQKNKICSRCLKEKEIYNKKNNLCKSCYNFIHVDKERQKEYLKEWRKEHPDYFKKYYKEKKNE